MVFEPRAAGFFCSSLHEELYHSNKKTYADHDDKQKHSRYHALLMPFKSSLVILEFLPQLCRPRLKLRADQSSFINLFFQDSSRNFGKPLLVCPQAHEFVIAEAVVLPF